MENSRLLSDDLEIGVLAKAAVEAAPDLEQLSGADPVGGLRQRRGHTIDRGRQVKRL